MLSLRRRVIRHRRLAIVVAAVLTGTSGQVADAQNATWALTGGGNWSATSSWVGGTLPGPSGVATFNAATVNATTGLGQLVTITDAIPGRIAGLTLNSVVPWGFNAGTGQPRGSIAFNGDLVLNITASPTQIPNNNYVSTFVLGHSLNAVILDTNIASGATVLVKRGAGTLRLDLGNTNAYSGGTVIEGGFLIAAGGDRSLGAVGTPVSLSGGGLVLVSGTGVTSFASNRPVSVTGPGNTLVPQLPVTLSGTLTGSGDLLIQKAGVSANGNVTLTAGSPLFSGRILTRVIPSTATALTLSGAGALTSVATLDVAGQLVLDNSVTHLSNRIADAAPILSRSAEVRLIGNAATATSETAGVLDLRGGATLITVAPGTGNSAALTFSAIQRDQRSSLVVRGTNLANTPGGADVASVFVTSGLAGELRGTGGAAGSPTVSVIPWIIGVNSATASLGAATANPSFATWDSVTGQLRPLSTTTEHVADINSANPDENVRVLSSAPTLASDRSVNSLSLVGSTINFDTNAVTPAVLTVVSGAVLSGNTGSVVNTPLAFGGSEGVLTAAATLTTNGRLSGTAGLTKTGPGTWFANSTSSDYTGTTTLLNGGLSFIGSLPADGSPSALGADTSAIVLYGGSSTNTVSTSLNALTDGAVIARGLRVIGESNTTVQLGNGASTANITVAGDIDLQRELVLGFGSVGTGHFTGTLSGPGRIRDSGATSNPSVQTFTASNSFTGGLLLASGTFVAAHDSAFGTGPIIAVTATGTPFGTLAATGAVVRTLANPLQLSTSQIVFGTVGGSPTAIVISGPVDLGGVQRTITTTGSAPVTLAGTFGPGNINKAGSGTLVLTGDVSSLLQRAVVSAGSLVLGNGTVPGTMSNGLLRGGVNVTAGSAVTLSFSGTTVVTTQSPWAQGAGTLVIDNADPVSVTSFSVSNALTGLIRVQRGVLAVGNAGTSGTLGTPSSISVAATGTVAYNRTGIFNADYLVTGEGSVAQTATGTTTVNNPNNSYSGETYITAGTLVVNGNLPAGVNSHLGNSSVPLRISPTTANAALRVGGSGSVVGRSLLVTGSAPSFTAAIGNLAGELLTLNGGITLDRELRLEFPGAGAVIHSAISGAGSLTDSADAANISNQTLTASSSFTGGTRIRAGNYILGNDSALGSGNITSAASFSGTWGTISATGGLRTLANRLVVSANNLTLGSPSHPDPLNFTGTVSFGSSVQTLVVHNTTTFSGDVSGSSTAGFVKRGTGALLFAGTPKTLYGNFIVEQGTFTANTSLGMPPPLGPVTGSLVVTGPGAAVLAAPPTLTSSPGYTLAARLADLTVNAGGSVTVAPFDRSLNKASVVVTSGLNLAGGVLDLGTSDLIVKGGAASLPDLRASLSAFLAGSGTVGLGSSIASPTAAPYTTLGVIANEEFGLPRLTSFDGMPVDATDAIVKYTYVGDTNFSGTLDAIDFNAVLNGFSNGLSGWHNGDFNHDGVTDVTDWQMFLPAYVWYASFGTPLGDGSGAVGSIPEPSAAGVLLLCAPLARRRRR